MASLDETIEAMLHQDQNSLLHHSSSTASRDSQLTLGQMIAEWGRRTPEAVAVMAPGRAPLTYARLQSHIESVVTQLNALG